MNTSSNLLLTTMVLSLAACGGGGGSSDVSSAVGDIGDVGEVLTGRLIDSAVAGMRYETPTQSGVTDADGSFSYMANETVIFSLGDIVLPPVTSAPVVTPLDVFSTSNIADARVINLTRLLQSLDEDGNADNGITLTSTAAASATGLTVDFGSTSFDGQVNNLVANSGSVITSLIDGESALDHFQETLFQEGIEERPQAPANPVTDAPDTSDEQPTSSDNPATHPLVGTSAEFSNFAHGIEGTLTFLDDRTFEVSNFSYDGGGPSVFFYLGTDGDYSSGGAGRLVGPRLNGRSYDSETITVTLPDDITLDDFNGVSVWCDIFFANFGDATF